MSILLEKACQKIARGDAAWVTCGFSKIIGKGNEQMHDLTNIYNELTAMKTSELEKCNIELNNNHNETVKKALMVYKIELLECLDMYDHYLNS